MRIAHKDGKIVSVGPATGDFEAVEIDTNLDPKIILRDFKLRERKLVPKSSSTRAALVSVWGVNCGISTYSGYLWSYLSQHHDEWRVFAEEEEGYGDAPNVLRCWRRGEPLTRLILELQAYDPDVIYIQHEYGYFPRASHWLSLMGALSGRNINVTLHSVYRHPDKLIIEASIPKIIVHTEAAKGILLNEKNVSGVVCVIPHGCNAFEPGRYWNLYGSSHTILQFGFGFRYKGWDLALKTVAEVKKTFPDVFFTGLLSERSAGQCSAYLAELNRMATDLDIVENVGLIQGFQSDQALDSYLRTNKVALFPYRDNGDHTVYGCSGAARVAMSKGIPVITSSLSPLFDDLEGIVPRPSTIEGWTDAILEVFAGTTRQGLQEKFLADNSWEKVARRYLACAATL